MSEQLGLFGDDQGVGAPPAAAGPGPSGGAHAAGAATRAGRVGPAPVDASTRELARKLPAGVRLGTSSWSFPGWVGLVYDRPAGERVLAREGLEAYAAHPLLGTVGLDRTFYRFLDAEALSAYAAAVPEHFRFVVKADRLLTSPLDPASTGVRRPNPRFLDAVYAAEAVVGPYLEGLGAKAGILLFQFPPVAAGVVGGPAAFAERLGAFLEALPRGPRYAVELRTAALLTPDYTATLDATGAAHGYVVHPAAAPLERQLELVPSFRQPVLMLRWMLHAGLGYEAARDRYQPFDRIVDEDAASLERIARAVLDAALAEREAFVVVNNKAEGSAPLSVARLARRLATWSPEGGPS